MIYFYKHKSLNEYSPAEIDMLGFAGVEKFANEHNLDAFAVFQKIKSLEKEIDKITLPQFDKNSEENQELLNKWLNKYISFFNNHADHKKQAYVVIGNIASGKSTFSKKLAAESKSIIVDADYYKIGKTTQNGYFEGFSSLCNNPTEMEKHHDLCSLAGKLTLENVSNLDMNLVLPKAPSNFQKMQNQLLTLQNKGYDIHLILVDLPVHKCANRNYYRFLSREYEFNSSQKGEHGRFVPIKIIKCIGDSPFEIFAKTLSGQGDIRFKSYRALFNEFQKPFEEIDLDTLKK